MKTMAQAWRLSLLAAVLVHLLALAGWQMARRRLPAPEGLRAADDTPILLQFSREEPLAQEAGSIPLPPAATRPPRNGPMLRHFRAENRLESTVWAAAEAQSAALVKAMRNRRNMIVPF